MRTLPLSGTFLVLAKPNAKVTALLGYDEEKEGFIISIKAPPEDNKANIALLKFLSKHTGKRVEIASGHTGKKKLVRVLA